MFDMKSSRSISSVLDSRRNRKPTIVGRVSAPDERRFSGRRPSESRAYIFASEVNEPVACTIKDQSSTGARLTIEVGKSALVTDASDIPDKFTLVIQRDRVSLDCSVAWRHDASLGLRFTSPARQLPKTTAAPRNQPLRKAR
jgi:PilZ domain